MADTPVRVRKPAGGNTNYVGTLVCDDDGAVTVLCCDPATLASMPDESVVAGESYGSLGAAFDAGWAVVA